MRLLLWVWLPTRLLIWWRRLDVPTHPPSLLKPKSFIIFRLDALGDLVLTAPLFRELKRAYPRARITVAMQEAYRSILTTNPNIDEVLTLPVIRMRWLPAHARRLLSVLLFYRRELSERRFDVAISPRWDTDEHLATLLCLLTNAGTRIGYSERASPGKRRYNRGFDRAFDICLTPGPLQHEVERNLSIVEALGARVREKHVEVHLTSEDREYARGVLKEAPEDSILIALGIGAQSPGRRWPIERYAAVVGELAQQHPVYAVITCAPSEHAEAARLARLLPVSTLISDSPKVRESCALLASCDLFLGNDTGAAHLAAAMRLPTIVISRHPRSGDPAHPNSPARFSPWCASSRVLQPWRGRDGCASRCTHVEPHCIKKVTTAEAVLAAKAMLMQVEHTRDKLALSLSL